MYASLFKKNNYLFLAMLGFCCCMGSSLVAVSRGFSLLTVLGFLVTAGSLFVEHRPQGLLALVVATPRLQITDSVVVVHGLSCSVACGIFLDQGLNLSLLHLAGSFLTTEPPGKPHILFIHSCFDGQLDCFNLLTIVNNATVNTDVHVSI